MNAAVNAAADIVSMLGYGQLQFQSGCSATFLHFIEWLAEEDPRGISHFAVPEFRQYLMQNAPLAMLGSTTDQVVCAAPCPVLTVHPPGRHA